MEINFACKRFPIAQVLRCAFGLSNAEFETLKALLRRKEVSAEELAASLEKDRTTVQRTLGPLIMKGLVRRRQYNLEGGGYQYFYSAVDKEKIKAQIQDHFEHFTEVVRKEVERW